MRPHISDPDRVSPAEINNLEREFDRRIHEYRAASRQRREALLARQPGHPTDDFIVDDLAFVMGLDGLYRQAMKRQERHALLLCARELASFLGVPPASVPIEGYYHEEPELTEYFRLVRGLQEVDVSRAGLVAGMPEYERLLEVTSSPIFGRASYGRLLPRSMDPLFEALGSVSPWSVEALVARAHEIVVEGDDCSLVGLAALTRDPVALAALRESVVLYSMTLSKSEEEPPLPRFLWRVDPALAARAARFIRTFNDLFDDKLPDAVAENAEEFYEAGKSNGIHGRCVCIAEPALGPARYYHWAIARGPDASYFVEELWSNELWTTQRYRAELSDRARAGRAHQSGAVRVEDRSRRMSTAIPVSEGKVE